MTATWAGTGDGSKDSPYSGEWALGQLFLRIQDGAYLAYDFKLVDGQEINVFDDRLNKQVVSNSTTWAVGEDLIGSTPHSDYIQYCKDNPSRTGHKFIVTSVSFQNNVKVSITGHFNEFYTTPDANGFVYVASAEQMWIILRGNSNVTANDHAKVRLTQDIYLSDIATGTFCSTFYGTLDGNDHTIYGSHDGTRQDKTYLFTYSDGATFKNLNFKNIRVDNRDHSNQCVITSQAKNECVFDNITFENISTYTSYDNSAAAVGKAENCTFTNITVKNSDFTVNENHSGTVAGYAENCTFMDIKVEHCESTSRRDDVSSSGESGGVVGCSNNCIFENVEVLDSFIKSHGKSAGGIAGYSEHSTYSNCTIDDQSCVYAQNFNEFGNAGGIIGSAHGDYIYNCINSALIDGWGIYVGGIVGHNESYNIQIDNCLNTGMIVCLDIDNLTGANGYYSKYKNKTLPCVTKYYNGKEYSVRKINFEEGSNKYFGGILGSSGETCSISRCANIGSMRKHSYSGGIVGFCFYATLKDCLSAFESPDNDVNGLIGGSSDYSDHTLTITNCINTTTAKNYDAGSKATIDINNLFSPSLENLTEEKLASGEICFKLGANWQQNIGTDAYPTPTGNKGVYHTRTVSNRYGTVCLPFEVQSDDNVKFYSFNEVVNSGDAVTFRFDPVDNVEAGHPALFSVENPGEITFEPVGDQFTSEPSSPTEINGWSIVGLLEGSVFSNDLLLTTYYVSNDKIRNASASLTIPAFRAYFTGPNISTLTGNGAQTKSLKFVIGGEYDETTALEFVGDDLVPMQQGSNSYSLMGTAVGENYRGLVIKNGKKIIQK